MFFSTVMIQVKKQTILYITKEQIIPIQLSVLVLSTDHSASQYRRYEISSKIRTHCHSNICSLAAISQGQSCRVNSPSRVGVKNSVFVKKSTETETLPSHFPSINESGHVWQMEERFVHAFPGGTWCGEEYQNHAPNINTIRIPPSPNTWEEFIYPKIVEIV